MAAKYLTHLSEIMKPATARRFTGVELEVKHFFSGAAVYANGRICISLTPVGFAIKLPEEARDVLLKVRGTKNLRYFPKGPIKKDYVVLPKSMLRDNAELRKWAKTAIEYVLTLPPPKKK